MKTTDTCKVDVIKPITHENSLNFVKWMCNQASTDICKCKSTCWCSTAFSTASFYIVDLEGMARRAHARTHTHTHTHTWSSSSVC